MMSFSMDKDKLVRILEEYKIKPELIDEILIQVNDIKSDPIKEAEFHDETELFLNSQLHEAVDWRKRAAIAAAIISHRLDN